MRWMSSDGARSFAVPELAVSKPSEPDGSQTDSPLAGRAVRASEAGCAAGSTCVWAFDRRLMRARIRVTRFAASGMRRG
jgi:hypothetical protein